MERVPFESTSETSPSIGSRITEKLKSGLEKLNPKRGAKKLGATALGLIGIGRNSRVESKDSFNSIDFENSKEKTTDKKSKKKSKIARALSLLFGRSDTDKSTEGKRWRDAFAETEERPKKVETAPPAEESETQAEFDADLTQDKKIGFVASYLASRELKPQFTETTSQKESVETSEKTSESKKKASETPAATINTEHEVIAETHDDKVAEVEFSPADISEKPKATESKPNLESKAAETASVTDKKSEAQNDYSTPKETQPKPELAATGSVTIAATPEASKIEESFGDTSRSEQLHARLSEKVDVDTSIEQKIQEQTFEAAATAVEKPDTKNPFRIEHSPERKSDQQIKTPETRKQAQPESSKSEFEREAKELEGEQLIHNPEFLKKRLNEERLFASGDDASLIEQLRRQGLRSDASARNTSGKGIFAKLISGGIAPTRGKKVIVIVLVVSAIVVGLLALL